MQYVFKGVILSSFPPSQNVQYERKFGAKHYKKEV